MTLVGLDEAGCGPVVGSLWAAAVHLRGLEGLEGLTDSKQVSERKRAVLRAQIVDKGHYYGLGEVTCAEIDACGMAEARRLVFERALADYVARGGPDPTMLEVDGTIFRSWTSPVTGHVVPHTCTPKADATVPCVSAASILAKTTRDAQISELCDAHPELDTRYDLRNNKGYLSPKHLAGLQEHGRSAWHRASFRIKALGE